MDAETGARRLVTSGDARHRPVVSPNGAQFALFRLEPDKAAEGSLWTASADGTGERVVLRFPDRADQRGFSTQIGWLPDSSGFWAAIPDTELDRPQRPNGLTLYRVPLKGDAQPVTHVDAHETFWSPDGTRLAYTKLTGDVTGPRELYLAAADSTNSQLYAAISSGRFVAWSPDSARFLYEDRDQLLMGAPGQKALLIGTGVAEPRWLGAGQLLYLTNNGPTRQLVYQPIDGKPAPIQTVPSDVTYDGVKPQ